MSSTKPPAKRQIISRWGVVVVALAVLAAGCSQSEDGASEGSEPATSSSQTSLGSAALSSPAAENAATSTSLSALATTTTQAPVEEEASGSGSEIAATTTSLSPAVVEGALSDEMVGLIDVAVDVCTDLLEFKCAGAVRDICFHLRSGDDVVLSEDDQFDICVLEGVVHYWEVDTVLSAKYGEEYYRWNPGFLAFRDYFHYGAISFLLSRSDLFPRDEDYDWLDPYWSENVIASFDEFVDDSTWAEYLPDAVRLKLLQLFYDIGLVLQPEPGNLSPKSEDVASRILGVSNFPEAHRECYGRGIDGSIKVSLAEMLTSDSIDQWEVFECIDSLCASREATDTVVCYFEDIDRDEFSNGKSILRDRSSTISGFFWNSIKYFCAKSAESDNAFPDDACHRVAANICEIAGNDDSLTVLIAGHSHLEGSASCRLSSALYYETYSEAKARCYSEIENVLTTMDLLSAQGSSCYDAAEECTEFWQNRNYVRMYYPADMCSLFGPYYALEIFWQKISLICSKNNTPSIVFVDSECYDSIRRFCDSHYSKVNFRLAYPIGGIDFSIYYLNPIRGGSKVRRALCSIILDARRQSSVKNNSGYKNLNLMPHESQKNSASIIDYNRPWAITNRVEIPIHSDDSIDSISSAVIECRNNSFATSEPKCVIALWKSCFDLLSYKISSKIPYFDAYYSFAFTSRLAFSYTQGYVCNATWIAELTRMATILSSSFPEDFHAGNFNQFLRYIADEAVDRGEGILTIDENGTARPNLDGIIPGVAERLTPLGNIITQLVQPYLHLPVATQQRDI